MTSKKNLKKRQGVSRLVGARETQKNLLESRFEAAGVTREAV
jgi:hypothetical protein